MNDDREVAGGTPAPGEENRLAPSEPEAVRAPDGGEAGAGQAPRAEAAGAPAAGSPPVDAAATAWPPPPPPPAHDPAAAFAAPGAAHAAPGAPGAVPADGSVPPPYGFPAGAYPGYPGFAAPAPKKRRRPNPLVATAVLTALLAGGVGGGIGAWIADRDNNSASSTVNTANPPVDPASVNRAPESVAGIAAKALPGTVTITTKSGSGGLGTQEGTGAGFVMDTEGHILTNNHVVALAADGGELTVRFADGTTVPGKIVGRAEGYDLAVVKVDNAPNLQPLPLGDSAAVAVGDAVLAIGSPYGLDGTVTTGIISAKDRPVASGDQQQVSYMNALQTDASINPGNSGGPLLDARGNVIGVNSAIRSGGGSDPFGGQQSTGSVGLGFAIPINQAKWVAETLIKTGKPVYAQVGVIPDPEYSGVGARIRQSSVQGQPPVTAGGPADKAGLKAGDVITKLGDHTITGYEDLFSEIWSHKPGETIKITYLRDGKEGTTNVTLGQREGDQ
ncbi:trypsin-like peptidase domain-containing protein [Yinghuangia sp. ASG 101]|uniref:S1C family serine protease n=1 Tax=Yinghuangia sp. ASG 101 TaxID=2896848 RepID=UPI001E2D13A2|nr:trypsin-like peptidase domain-containing protein [Yinghuangia sp. ASG 101]UGQ15193.1 trypsin-like peptidase domain-containing protein [Yinghuangia sp. ASG 101]